MTTAGASGATSWSVVVVESGMVMKEAVDGVLAVSRVSDGGEYEVMTGSRLEVESGSTGVSHCVMSLPVAEEMNGENSSSEGRESQLQIIIYTFMRNNNHLKTEYP